MNGASLNGAAIFYPASPVEIRDGTVSRIRAIPFFKNVYGQRTKATKDDQLPIASVYHSGETTTPDGDANVGEPRFIHTLKLVVHLLVAAKDDDTLDGVIVNATEFVRGMLMTDSTWVDLFEGIERCDVRYAYPRETNDTFAQASIEFEVTFRSKWPPVAPNDFRQVVVGFSEPCKRNLDDYVTAIDIPQGRRCP